MSAYAELVAGKMAMLLLIIIERLSGRAVACRDCGGIVEPELAYTWYLQGCECGGESLMLLEWQSNQNVMQ